MLNYICCCCKTKKVADEETVKYEKKGDIEREIRVEESRQTEKTEDGESESEHAAPIASTSHYSIMDSSFTPIIPSVPIVPNDGIRVRPMSVSTTQPTNHSRCLSTCSLTSSRHSLPKKSLSRQSSVTKSENGEEVSTRPRYYSSASSLASTRTEGSSISLTKMRRELLGFGLSSEGQLGIRTVTDQNGVRIPEHIVGAPCGETGASIRQIACGEKHTIILADDGKIWSVGNNENGQLGRGRRGAGSYTIYPVEFTAGVGIVQISSGRDHCMCVTDDGRLFAWGNNASGQLGMPTSMQVVEKPKRVSSLTEVVQVSCGPEHTIVLTESGRVYTFGLQYDGACWHAPTEVSEFIGVPIVRVSAGGRHWVALSASGSVFTWGQNDYGQLGTGDTTRRAHPVRLDNISQMRVVEAVCGDAHTILLTRDGRLFAFGSDGFGQLGCGRRKEIHTMPVAVHDLMGSQVTRVAAGRCHTVVVIKGKLYTFGLNSSGQLGNGSVRNQITPRQLDDLDHVGAVFAGWDQTFIVRAAGVPDLLPGPNSEIRVPRFLSKSSVLGLFQEKKKLDLIGDLESVFTSLSSINGSFLYDDERKFSISEKNHGVNMDEVMETFNTLSQCIDNRQYSDLISESCQISFFSSDFEPRNFLSEECLRPFLILPWVNTFIVAPDMSVVESFHIPYANAFALLKPAQAKVLERWWRELPVRHFNRLVSSLVHGLNKAVKAGACPTKCAPMLNVLSRLNDINRKECKIPLENFYVSDLADVVDIKMDYLKWATREKNVPSDPFFWSNYPFILNGIAKGELLNVEARLQQQTMVNNSAINFLGMNLFLEHPYFSITVRREHIVNDTINALMSAPPNSLQKPLKVEFYGEEGQDGGGIKKEFFMILFQKILQAEYGMFIEDTDSHLVWFSGAPTGEASSFQMVGALCGLAVYNGVLVAFPFPSALYKMILGQPINLEDFRELHPVEGRSLQQLLDYEGDDFEDTFCLYFTTTLTVFGHPEETELKPHGKDLSVNQQNKQEYVQLYVRSRMEQGLNGEIRKQIDYFKEGFMTVINSRIINFFQPRELMELVVGNENYDWHHFKEVVEYKGEYYAKHPTIIAFWDAFFELTVEERKQFLQFLMGSTRLPVQGMKAVSASIQPTASHCLPVAHTCFNLLDLPNIADKKELLRRLRISIQHQEGFTLV